MDIVRFAEEAMTKPSDFGWWGRDDMFITWGFSGISKHRDSNILEISNYYAAIRRLTEEFGEEGHIWETVNMGHWAVGSVDTVIVQILKPDLPIDEDTGDWLRDITEDDLTDIFKFIYENDLWDNSEIFDDQDYYDREEEASIRNIVDWGPSMIDTDRADEILTWLIEESVDYYNDGNGYSYKDDDIRLAAWHIGAIEEDEAEWWFDWAKENDPESYVEFVRWVNAVHGQEAMF